jgi:hypothetical protein
VGYQGIGRTEEDGHARDAKLCRMSAYCLLWTAPAHATVTVAFASDPDRYTDIRNHGLSMAGEIKAYILRLGARYVPPNQHVKITILDIDLAGMDETFRNPSLPRIMRESTWPRIRLRYELTQNRRVISSGEELVSDQMYLGRLGTASSSDPLRYEKNMLDDWFRKKFAAGR